MTQSPRWFDDVADGDSRLAAGFDVATADARLDTDAHLLESGVGDRSDVQRLVRFPLEADVYAR